MEEAKAKFQQDLAAINKLANLIKAFDPTFESPFKATPPEPISNPIETPAPEPPPVAILADQRRVNKINGVKVYQVENVRDAVLKVLPYRKSEAIPSRVIVRRIKELGLTYEVGTIFCAISAMQQPNNKFFGYKGPDGASITKGPVKNQYRRKGLHWMGYYKQWV